MFMPARPYMLEVWVPGKVVDKNLIEFERKETWFDPAIKHYPDILVNDREYNLKYALDGVPPGLGGALDKGYLYP
jgi:hypothetical protein